MFIYVKVDPARHLALATWKLMAWRAWRLNRLLNDTPFRNSKKIMIVLSGGAVVATFCIHGVGLDSVVVTPSGMNVNLVRFVLEDTTPACHAAIVAFMTPAMIAGIAHRSYGYIGAAGFGPLCPCIAAVIPVYPTHSIFNGELI